MYVGAGLLVGVTIILVGWVFCFCFFISFFRGVGLGLSRVRYTLYSSPAGHSRLAGVSFFERGCGCTFFGLVECPAGALFSSLAGTLSSSPAGAHFIELSRCSFSDTGLSSSLVVPLSWVKMTLFL